MLTRFSIMKLNDVGPNVAAARKLLAKAGSSIKPGKKFDIGMLSAVKSFQKKNGLQVTGVIDKKTWDKLSAKPAPKKAGGVKK